MMGLNDFLLYVLFLGVIVPIVLAAVILYLGPKDKIQETYRKRIIPTAIGMLIGCFLLATVLLWKGNGLDYAFSRIQPYLITIVTVYPLTWLILMYLQKRRLS